VRIETVLTEGLWPALVDAGLIEPGDQRSRRNARRRAPDVSRSDAPPDLRPGDYVLISGADSGEGMTEEVLSKAVEPFCRGDGDNRGRKPNAARIGGACSLAAGAGRPIKAV
jgi:hypothetical protein